MSKFAFNDHVQTKSFCYFSSLLLEFDVFLKKLVWVEPDDKYTFYHKGTLSPTPMSALCDIIKELLISVSMFWTRLLKGWAGKSDGL